MCSSGTSKSRDNVVDHWNQRADNALIDTLVARLIASNYLLKTAVTEGTHGGWMPTAGASLNLNEQALAEAKKWRGEV